MFNNQAEYVAYNSPEQRSARSAEARRITDEAIKEAHRLFFVCEDADAARSMLFSAGLQAEGINFYMECWNNESI